MLSEADRRLTAKRIDIGFENGRAVTASAAGDVKLDSANGHAEAARGTLGFAPDGTAQNTVLEGGVRLESDGRGRRRRKGGRADVAPALAAHGRRAPGGPRAERRLQALRRRDRDRPGRADRPRSGPRASRVHSRRPEEGAHDGLRRRPKEADVRQGGPDRPGRRAPAGDVSPARLRSGRTTRRSSPTTSRSRRRRAHRARVRERAHRDGPCRPAKPAGAEARPASVITSKRLLYRDSDRSARFEGGVAVTRGGWRASGRRIDRLARQGRPGRERRDLRPGQDVRPRDRPLRDRGQGPGLPEDRERRCSGARRRASRTRPGARWPGPS